MNLLSAKVLTVLAVVVSACVVLASGFLCYLNPERAWAYSLAIAVVSVAWAIRYLSGRGGEADAKSQAKRRKLTQAIVSSGLILGFALGGVLMARLGWK
jgi:uncharacterized oligopeptide transporter (OPT) family protein